VTDWKGLGNPLSDHAACGVGAVVGLTGSATHRIVDDGLTLLRHLDHRGARGAEEKTGDGAGMLLAKPHGFFAEVVADLPPAPDYAVGQLFLPQDATLKAALVELIEGTAAERHFVVLGWRCVPTDSSDLGATARARVPSIDQVFVTPVLPIN